MVKNKKSRKEIAEAVGCNIHLLKRYIRENDLSLIDYEQHKFRDMLIEHKDDVIQLYENCKNLSKVGEHFNCSGKVIVDFLKSIGYSYTKKNHEDLTPYLEEIRKLYYEQNLTLLEIGEKFGCSFAKIGKFLRNNGYHAKDKSEMLRTRNSSEEFQKKCISSSGRKKEYLLPSGDKIFIRGYEPNFLDYVFENKILSEDEIDYTPKRVKYTFAGKSCHYYPDFYIPKFNLIVETKSSWIYKKQGDLKNLDKEYAVKQKGFNFVLIIDNDFSKLAEFINNK
jgi:transcriptional regulator with XRE-family HTH domain